jgi:carbamoyl-phosphate synthase large subunit
MRILVSGASGVVGYGIAKSLGMVHGQHKIIGTTIYDYSAAEVFCDVVEKILPTDHPGYMENLLNLIEKHKIDILIPSIECDMYKWNEERETLLTTRAFPLLNNSSLLDLCQDKWVFYTKLVVECPQYAIPTVPYVDYGTFRVPFLLKPKIGFGSKGVIKIKSDDDLKNNNYSWRKNYMTQPIIGTDDEEYTVSGFFDKDSSLIDYFPLKRKLSGEGFTQQAEVADRNFEEVLVNLAKTFKPIGPTNFQFRMDGENPKLLEINPRISSATSIRAAFGYNESEMSIDYFLRFIRPEKQDKAMIMGRKAIRYTEDFIF